MTLGRLLFRAVLVVAIPVALAVLVVKWRVAVTLDRWIEQAQPFAQVSRGSSFVGLDGTIGVDQLAITANQTDIGTVRADRVTLHTPGLWWVVRNGVLGGNEVPRRLGLSVEGLDTSLLEMGNDQPTLVGELSAAAFDYAGCQEDPFIEAELIELGVARGSARLFAGYTITDGTAMRVDSGIERAGSAASDIALLLRLPGSANLDVGSLMGAGVEAIEVSLRDDGFASARNAACAERLKIADADFNAAHVAMAERIALALGVSADSAWWEEYARFASDGGSLKLVGTPQRALTLVGLQQVGGFGGPLFDWRSIRDGGTARPTQITGVEAQPLDGGKPRSLAAQLQAEMDADRAQRAGMVASPPLAETPAPAANPVLGAAAAPEADVATAAPNAPVKVGPWTTIEYAQLGERIGSTLQVETIHGTRREGTLEQWNPAGMVLRLGPNEGGIPLSLSPRDVRSIRIRE